MEDQSWIVVDVVAAAVAAAVDGGAVVELWNY